MKKITLLPIFCFIFILTSPVYSTAAPAKNVEIFNVSKREVTDTLTPNKKIQREAEKMIKQITGVYKSLDPLPKTGYMVKIPLEPNILVNNQWIQGYLDEVIVIIPDKRTSHILVFDDENNPRFFTYENEQQPPMELFNLK